MPENNEISSSPEITSDSFDFPCKDGCKKTGYQYADISVPIDLKPNATIGEIKSECCGEPSVYCKENHKGNSCEITITQKILIKIPVDFNVIACVGEEEISCGNDDPCCYKPKAE